MQSPHPKEGIFKRFLGPRHGRRCGLGATNVEGRLGDPWAASESAKMLRKSAYGVPSGLESWIAARP